MDNQCTGPFMSTNQMSGILTKWSKKNILHNTDSPVRGLQAQQCRLTPSWAHCLNVNMKLHSYICSFLSPCLCVHPSTRAWCLFVSTNAKSVCPVRGGHAANRKVLKKTIFSKQCTEQWDWEIWDFLPMIFSELKQYLNRDTVLAHIRHVSLCGA